MNFGSFSDHIIESSEEKDDEFGFYGDPILLDFLTSEKYDSKNEVEGKNILFTMGCPITPRKIYSSITLENQEVE